MKTLILLRHGKSSWDGGEDDHDRPLAKRGRRQAPEAGAWLAAHLPDIELAVVSTAVRARETWELASGELGLAPAVRFDEDAYAAWGETLRDLVRALPEEHDTVALVGHNPGLEDLVEMLSGEYLTLPTSCIAVLTWQGPWQSAGVTPAQVLAHGRPPAAPSATMEQ